MLVYRVGTWRKEMVPKITKSKMYSLVLALCKLHHFCIPCNFQVPQTARNIWVNCVIGSGLLIPRVDNPSALYAYHLVVQNRLVRLLGGGQYACYQDDWKQEASNQHDNLPYTCKIEYIELEQCARPSTHACWMHKSLFAKQRKRTSW